MVSPLLGLYQDQRHRDLPGGYGEDSNHDGGAEAATAKNSTKMAQSLLDKGASVLAVAKVIVALITVRLLIGFYSKRIEMFLQGYRHSIAAVLVVLVASILIWALFNILVPHYKALSHLLVR